MDYLWVSNLEEIDEGTEAGVVGINDEKYICISVKGYPL